MIATRKATRPGTPRLSPGLPTRLQDTSAAQRPAGSTVLHRPWKSENGTLYHPQWQRPDGRPAGAIWSFGTSRELALTFSSKAITFTTHTGGALAPRWRDNTTTCVLPVSEAPIYFTGGTLERITPADAQQ